MMRRTDCRSWAWRLGVKVSQTWRGVMVIVGFARPVGEGGGSSGNGSCWLGRDGGDGSIMLMVLLLFVDEIGHQNSEKLGNRHNGEATRRGGRGAALEISQVDGEESLDIGVEHDNTDSAKAGMKFNSSEGEGQTEEMMVGIDNGDRLTEQGGTFNRGIV
jgi:hypothetical protein